MSIFRLGTVSKRINLFVNNTKLLLWIFKPHLCLHFLSKKAPLIARILRLSCRYCFPVHQWSMALIYEQLVDFSHFWHYKPTLSKYNECEVTQRQECWLKKTQNDWSDSEICEIWTQIRSIPVILWFAFLHISPFKILSINVVTPWAKYLYWFISL